MKSCSLLLQRHLFCVRTYAATYILKINKGEAVKRKRVKKEPVFYCYFCRKPVESVVSEEVGHDSQYFEFSLRSHLGKTLNQVIQETVEGPAIFSTISIRNSRYIDFSPRYPGDADIDRQRAPKNGKGYIHAKMSHVAKRGDSLSFFRDCYFHRECMRAYRKKKGEELVRKAFSEIGFSRAKIHCLRAGMRPWFKKKEKIRLAYSVETELGFVYIAFYADCGNLPRLDFVYADISDVIKNAEKDKRMLRKILTLFSRSDNNEVFYGQNRHHWPDFVKIMAKIYKILS
jgi:hypothetical protein